MQKTYKNLKKNLPNFVERSAQVEMINMVSDTLSHGGIATVEGPCGTGKSLGYMVGAIPFALKKKKKVVISTATTALQGQIMAKDLPLLTQHGKLNISYALAKGRSRYLCLEKLSHEIASGSDKLTHFQNRLKKGWNGDIDELDGGVDKSLWHQVNCDAYSCTKQQCIHYNDCAFFKARKAVNDADVIVANHDMVFSDIKTDGAVLPPVEETIYIFDEAHHLPDKGKNQFTFEFRLREVAPNLLNLVKLLSDYPLKESEFAKAREEINKLAKACVNKSNKLLESLTAVKPSTFQSNGNADVWRFPHGNIPARLTAAIDSWLTQFDQLYTATNSVIEYLRNYNDRSQVSYDDYMEFYSDAGKVIGVVERINYTLKTLAAAGDSNSVPRAYWIERILDHENIDFRLVTSPIDVSRHLRHYIWNKCYGAVVTSATITSFGNFNYFAKACGLNGVKGAKYLKLEPHFDFEKQGYLIVPVMKADPKAADAHTAEIIESLPRMLATDGGNLVLFASRKQMEAVYDGMPEKVQKAILKQGSMSKPAILATHKANVESGKPSTIFGLASFAEGIDLARRLCVRVFIAKLPFSVPTSPQELATNEWITAQGGNPFQEVTLHEATTVLKQQVGRLIRTDDDHGEVVVLDKRLLTKGYGKYILDALPPFKRLTDVPLKDLFTSVVPLAA